MKQISIFAANEPGTLLRLCESLKEANINLLGLSVVDHVDHALIRLVADRPNEALHMLEETGLPIMDNDVLFIELNQGAGSLARIASIIGEANLNIDYAYATEASGDGRTGMVLKTSDNARAIDLLQKEFGN